MLLRMVERWATNRHLMPAVLLFGLVLLLVNELSFRYTRETVAAEQRILVVEGTSRRLMQMMSDAEAAQRGFLLTSLPEYLQPYEQALQRIGGEQRALREYLLQRGDEGRTIERRLGTALDAKLSELKTTTDLARAGRMSDAVEMVASGIGREYMEAIRAAAEEARRLVRLDRDRSRAAVDTALQLRRVAIALMVLLGVFGIYLFARQAERRDAERRQQQEALAAEQQKSRAAGQLRDLAEHLQRAREDEREQVARSLHDEFGALFTTAQLDLMRARAKVGDEQAVAQQLDQLAARLADVVRIKRHIMERLRPPALSSLGLQASLGILCNDAARALGVPVELQAEPLPLSADAELTMYRFVQEALENIRRHARATRVDVRLQRDGDLAQALVQDDGSGFEPVDAAQASGGHGLAELQLRVETLDGTMAIESSAGRGTRLRVRLPLQDGVETPAPLPIASLPSARMPTAGASSAGSSSAQQRQ